MIEGEKLGELGLYMKLLDQFGPGGEITGSLNPPVALFSRFNLGTDAFVPDPTRPVIVEWIIIYHLPMISQIQTLM